jgi:hypothetical protein
MCLRGATNTARDNAAKALAYVTDDWHVFRSTRIRARQSN